ncbi:hypothetical protein [Massilia sp. CF038]|uniref:hypothetical protein n=1 Tax=Massilia sp. CF038 TaxID=1881045 RepID=UPI000918F0A5|nr:hypothetical protein [Massilia sp. CF038]SHH18861.1 hypothetical protein SAMN05428948_3222 [Massilia sp. CF038]
MYTAHVERQRGALALLLCAVLSPALAAPPGWIPVTQAVLSGQRGGFVSTSGLEVALGIERLVAINGVTVTHTTVQIPDITRLSVEQARQTRAALSEVNLVQNGSGNIYLAAMSDAALAGTVIQNTLNDQRIDSRTTISASVNSMDMLNTLHFNGNLSDAIARAAGP